MKKLKALWELFVTFFAVGLFTFGGGYAMISIIEDKCVDKKKWITHDEMMDITVIAESTPGPVAINLATYVGYKKAGLSGATVATFGVVLPSFLVIFTISCFFDNFLEIKVVASAFKGIKIGVGFLIVNAAVNMIKKMKKKAFNVAVAAVTFCLMLCVNIFSLRLSTVVVMICAAILSLILFFFKRKGEKSK